SSTSASGWKAVTASRRTSRHRPANPATPTRPILGTEHPAHRLRRGRCFPDAAAHGDTLRARFLRAREITGAEPAQRVDREPCPGHEVRELLPAERRRARMRARRAARTEHREVELEARGLLQLGSVVAGGRNQPVPAK